MSFLFSAPRPRRNPPRVSNQEPASRAPKKRIVEVLASDSEALQTDKAASDMGMESEASDEDPSPQNTDVRPYFPFRIFPFLTFLLSRTVTTSNPPNLLCATPLPISPPPSIAILK